MIDERDVPWSTDSKVFAMIWVIILIALPLVLWLAAAGIKAD